MSVQALEHRVRPFAAASLQGVLRWGPVWLPALLAFALVLLSPAVLNDGDTFWHLTAGQWIWDHGQVPRTDPFSYTFAGRPWHAHEWLAEAAMALAYRAGGWAGLTLLGGAAAALAVGVLARELLRRLERPMAVLALVLAAGCLAPGLLLRPHLLMLPLLALWVSALLEARAAGRSPPLAWALLILVWANVHASVVFALALIAPFALEAVVEARAGPWPVLRGWGLFAAASLAAALVTPFGLDGLLFPLRVGAMASLDTIVEWRPLDVRRLQPVHLAVGVALAALLWRGARLSVPRLLLLLLLLQMTLSHQRHQVLLAVVGVLIVAEALGAPPALAPPDRSWRPALAVALLAAVSLSLLRLALPIVRSDSPVSPVEAVSQTPAALRRLPVLNDYGMGGYLIFQGVRPFIDGRTDMYGDAFDRPYSAALAGDRAALDRLLARHQVAWTLLQPSSPAVRLMDSSPGWRRLYSDPYAVIHVRSRPRR